MFSHTIKFIFLWISLFVYAVPPVNAQTELNDEVTLDVAVVVKGEGFVVNLTASHFEIFAGNKEQKIKSVTQNDEPISIGILLDLSHSMDGAKFKKTENINLVENGLIEFIKQSNPANEYFILGFNKQSITILDNDQDKNKVLKTLEQISEVKMESNTAFYDALYNSIEKISNSKHQKRVLLLISDGYDNASKKDYGDIKQILKEKNIMVYSVSLFNKYNAGSMYLNYGQELLDELCKITGGLSIVPIKEKHVSSLFSYIAEDLRNQYKITFDLKSDEENREWHKLKVKLDKNKNLRKAVVRTREGIYTKKKEN